MSGLKYIIKILEIIFKPFSKIKHCKSDCCACECDSMTESRRNSIIIDEILEEKEKEKEKKNIVNI